MKKITSFSLFYNTLKKNFVNKHTNALKKLKILKVIYFKHQHLLEIKLKTTYNKLSQKNSNYKKKS